MTPFDHLADYMALPRLAGLRLAPDGSWLAVTVQTLSADGRTYAPSIWRIGTGRGGLGRDGTDGAGAAEAGADEAGTDRAAVRLTRSAEGEDSPAFLPDGSLLFLSSRPAPPASRPAAPGDGDGPAGKNGAAEETTGKRALWLLPASGGEARQVAAPPGGIAQLATAAGAALAAFTAPVLPGAHGLADDAGRRKARKDAGVTAILHESAPVRYWDHDLGPDELRLLATPVSPGADPGTAEAASWSEPRELTAEPGRALDEQSFELTPDGRYAVTGWSVYAPSGEQRVEVAVIDTQSGARRTLLSAPGYDFYAPRVSPDGRSVLAIREQHDSLAEPADLTLVLAPLDGSTGPADLLGGLDRWPAEAAWAPDGQHAYFAADDHGRRPVFRIDLGTATVTRLTSDDGAYSALCPAPDGRFLYALRAAVDSPPTAVRLDLTGPDAAPRPLASPAPAPDLPGQLTEIETVTSDGAAVRAWLVLPDGADAGLRRRCCCGSMAGRCPAGIPGPGGGIRG